MDNQNLSNNNPAGAAPVPGATPNPAATAGSIPNPAPQPANTQPAAPAFNPFAAPQTQPQQPPKVQPYNGSGSIIAPAVDPNAPIEPTTSGRHRKNTGNILLLVGLIIAVLSTLTFIGLFIWMYLQYDEASTDLQGQINAAVATAVQENTTKMEEEFIEREKEPNKTFTGPEDYGQVSFQYPKTWSVYIESDAANGGNFQAYFSPNEILPINSTTPNSLRLTINTQSFESSIRTYESYVNTGQMTMKIINVGGNSANLYTGKLQNTLMGAACLIKIRDKTVVLQTDAEIYMNDFLKLLNTVTYNS